MPVSWRFAACCKIGAPPSLALSGCFSHVLIAPPHCYLHVPDGRYQITGTFYSPQLDAMTKMKALSTDLDALRAAEPHMHAVVFTQHSQTHAMVVSVAQAKGIKVYQLKGGVAAASRHKCIRDFQTQEKVAKVIVATLKTGNCGVTLTAATRVFLMEPFIDPAHEVQAAGRIHRLGQQRDVFVKRYCFRGTIDEKIVALHKKIKSGKLVMVDGRLPWDAVKEFKNEGR